MTLRFERLAQKLVPEIRVRVGSFRRHNQLIRTPKLWVRERDETHAKSTGLRDKLRSGSCFMRHDENNEVADSSLGERLVEAGQSASARRLHFDCVQIESRNGLEAPTVYVNERQVWAHPDPAIDPIQIGRDENATLSFLPGSVSDQRKLSLNPASHQRI